MVGFTWSFAPDGCAFEYEILDLFRRDTFFSYLTFIKVPRRVISLACLRQKRAKSLRVSAGWTEFGF